MKPLLLTSFALFLPAACSDAGGAEDVSAGTSATVPVATAPVAKAPVFDPWESKLVDGEAFLKNEDYSFDDDIFHCALCRDAITRDDALTEAIPSGIVWYGEWEDALAEMDRTGRPLLLHFGSPQVMDVCGVW